MLDQTELEKKACVQGLRELARSNQVSEDVAVVLYEHELIRLSLGAKVQRYIGLLAEKHARQALKRRSNE